MGLLTSLGPLYHSYRLFGIDNNQISDVYIKNQQSKEATISAYMCLALSKSRKRIADPVSFAELFCADGYYCMLARHFGYTTSVGIDNDRDNHFVAGREIAARLDISDCNFVKEDINNIDRMEQVDVVANVGGLYHVPNPEEILEKSYAMAKRFLIVQTVVSLANESEDYFQAPAPGWSWGSRYNPRSFDKMINSKGWNILDSHLNILEGNGRPEDNGSIYYLIKKD